MSILYVITNKYAKLLISGEILWIKCSGEQIGANYLAQA
jgi:hypothetical protein